MDRLSGFFKRKTLWPLVSVVVLLAGIVFGGLACSLLSAERVSGLNHYLIASLNTVALLTDRTAVAQVAIEANILDLLKLAFLGLCVVGIPLILLFLFIKGFSIGFVLSFLLENSGWSGVPAILISVVLPKLFYLPLLLMVAFYAINFSHGIVTGMAADLFRLLTHYIFLMILLLLGMILAGYLEGFLAMYGATNILPSK